MKGGLNTLSNVDIFSESSPFVKIVWNFFMKIPLPSAWMGKAISSFRAKNGLAQAADHAFSSFLTTLM